MKNVVPIHLSINSTLLEQMPEPQRSQKADKIIDLSPAKMLQALEETSAQGNWAEWATIAGVFVSFTCSTYRCLYQYAELETLLEMEYFQTLATLDVFCNRLAKDINTMTRQIQNEEKFDTSTQHLIGWGNWIIDELDMLDDLMKDVKASPFKVPDTEEGIKEFQEKVLELESSMYPKCDTLPYTQLALIAANKLAAMLADYALHVTETISQKAEKEYTK